MACRPGQLIGVVGRLGHSGCGTTTLRVYAAWVSEADQRAAGTFGQHMPALPVTHDADRLTVGPEVGAQRAANPYQKIAAHLRAEITCGALRPGDQLPTVNELGSRYDVTPSTAHRAITALVTEGLVIASRGRRATVVQLD